MEKLFSHVMVRFEKARFTCFDLGCHILFVAQDVIVRLITSHRAEFTNCIDFPGPSSSEIFKVLAQGQCRTTFCNATSSLTKFKVADVRSIKLNKRTVQL
jgi:hypothetical protein